MGLFKPIVSLTLDPSLKTYTMDAMVVVPNGCYSEAGARLGVPGGMVVTPETEGVILTIVKHDGPCTQGLKVLSFSLPRIPLTIGKSILTAFAVIDDKSVGTTSAQIPQLEGLSAEAGEPQAPSGVRITSVNAWINAMPPGPPRLIAMVHVCAPCSNYTFNFTDKGGFGITGRTLLVALQATRPEVCLTAVFDGPLRFEKPLDSPGQFDSIAIEFEGQLYLDPLEIAA